MILEQLSSFSWRMVRSVSLALILHVSVILSYLLLLLPYLCQLFYLFLDLFYFVLHLVCQERNQVLSESVPLTELPGDLLRIVIFIHNDLLLLREPNIDSQVQ